MSMKYCPQCANRLENRYVDGVERKAYSSPECGFVHWDYPVPVVAGLVEYQDRIILARNAKWPDGMFSVVTGFLERKETPEQAVLREVKEELGLDGAAKDFIGYYPLFEKNQIILAFWVRATGECKISDEIAEIRLVSREELMCWQFGRLALTSAIIRDWLSANQT